jgi:hypothetical protein
MGNACGQMMRNYQNRCHFDDLETVSHEFVNTMLYVYAVSPELCVDTFLHFLGRPAYLSPLSPETYKVFAPQRSCSNTAKKYNQPISDSFDRPPTAHLLLRTLDQGELPYTLSARVDRCVLTHGPKLLFATLCATPTHGR